MLPPLPKPDTHCFDDDTGKDVWSYSESQLLADRAAVIEACAKVCEEEYGEYFADAIRSLLK